MLKKGPKPPKVDVNAKPLTFKDWEVFGASDSKRVVKKALRNIEAQEYKYAVAKCVYMMHEPVQYGADQLENPDNIEQPDRRDPVVDNWDEYDMLFGI
jgi:hypothetical protein